MTPLFQLKALTDRPYAPILVVEGEKASEAAKERFPEMVVTTWQGGANAVHLTDWTPLHDREVVLWPDNDRAGHRAMEHVAQRCTYAGAKGVTCIEMTVDDVTLPPGGI